MHGGIQEPSCMRTALAAHTQAIQPNTLWNNGWLGVYTVHRDADKGPKNRAASAGLPSRHSKKHCSICLDKEVQLVANYHFLTLQYSQQEALVYAHHTCTVHASTKVTGRPVTAAVDCGNGLHSRTTVCVHQCTAGRTVTLQPHNSRVACPRDTPRHPELCDATKTMICKGRKN
jgi:hypothetical protein